MKESGAKKQLIPVQGASWVLYCFFYEPHWVAKHQYLHLDHEHRCRQRTPGRLTWDASKKPTNSHPTLARHGCRRQLLILQTTQTTRAYGKVENAKEFLRLEQATFLPVRLDYWLYMCSPVSRPDLCNMGAKLTRPFCLNPGQGQWRPRMKQIQTHSCWWASSRPSHPVAPSGARVRCRACQSPQNYGMGWSD